MSDGLTTNMSLELYGFSALDRYFDIPEAELPVFAVTTEDPAAIAREAEELSFPGVAGVDAEALVDGSRVLFRCADAFSRRLKPRIPVLDFRYVPARRVFRDPAEAYYHIRDRDPGLHGDGDLPVDWTDIAELAVLASRYGFRLPALSEFPEDAPPLSAYLQRLYLSCLLTGKHPAAGFSFLMKSGFIRRHWPEILSLDKVDHGKEYHPEGNVWQHTLETFSYRKTRDLTLSLALLLHDIGKSRSVENEGNRFDRHAQIGGGMAVRFLKNLGFSDPLVEHVRFLVSRHMMPAMIVKLPVFRTEDTMSHPLFPLLLEVYRCDISSTFRGPDGYYEACRAYREFLKNKKNPFRTSAGKKFLRTYVE